MNVNKAGELFERIKEKKVIERQGGNKTGKWIVISSVRKGAKTLIKRGKTI